MRLFGELLNVHRGDRVVGARDSAITVRLAARLVLASIPMLLISGRAAANSHDRTDAVLLNIT